jgi:hypothetical protein
MPWQVVVEEKGKNRKVQDDAPDDCQDSVLPHARGSVVLPVPEEARNHDREGQTQHELNGGGAPTVERHGNEPRNDHRSASPSNRYNGATVGLRIGPRTDLRESPQSRAPTLFPYGNSLQYRLPPGRVLSIVVVSGNRWIDVDLPEQGIHLTAVLELFLHHVEEHFADGDSKRPPALPRHCLAQPTRANFA